MQATILEQIVIAGGTVSQETTLTGTGLQSVDEAIPDSTTDGLIAFALDVSQVVALLILSDQALTLETNNGGAPDETLVLVADVPYVWYTNKEDALVFSVDITALYATNASGSTANLKIRALYDATP